MQPEQLQLGFLKVLKGSDMHEHAKEYGIRYLEQPPYEVLYTNWISYGEIRRLKRIEEMVELYYNSGQFTHTLSVLEKHSPVPLPCMRHWRIIIRNRDILPTAPPEPTGIRSYWSSQR